MSAFTICTYLHQVGFVLGDGYCLTPFLIRGEKSPTYLAAAHFQNHRVPVDQACYTCHTNYAMFGGFRAKFNGLHHVYVQYLGKPHDPIRLYEPYSNRECLHCHLGARSFEEGAVNTADPDLLPGVKANKVSCLSSTATTSYTISDN